MSHLIPGLVSITFRQLSPPEIIGLVGSAKLRCIEWGGDIHVPHGDLTRAREVGRQTREAGLDVTAYGSYYWLGASEARGLAFEQVLETAVVLGAPTIRVWAGNKGSADTTEAERAAVIDDALRVAGLAGAQGLTVSLEYHAKTLTDTRESVQRLLVELAHPHLKFLWQPSHGETVEQGIARLQDVLPWLHHVHVFHWWPDQSVRYPLAQGETQWRSYLEVVRSAGQPMPCLLEFVLADQPAQFLEDAASLLRCLALPDENA